MESPAEPSRGSSSSTLSSLSTSTSSLSSTQTVTRNERTPLLSIDRAIPSSAASYGAHVGSLSTNTLSLDDLTPKTTPSAGHARRPTSHRPLVTLRHAVMLLLACYLLFGSYFCMELPSALNTQLHHHLGIPYAQWQYELNWLFSVASVPNVIVPFLGGIALDRYGLGTTLTVVTACVIAGQAIFALGVSAKMFSIMLAGRFVFGLGAGSLEVIQGKITTEWFEHTPCLAFALGLNLTVGRIATAVNYNLTPLLDQWSGGAQAGVCWIGVGICISSALAGYYMYILDQDESRIACGVDPSNIPHRSNTASPDNGAITIPKAGASSSLSITKHLVHFSTSFWILCVVIFLIYGAVQPFMHISFDFLHSVYYPDSPAYASSAQSIPDILSSVLSPMYGLLTDMIGRRASSLPFGCLIIAVSHLTLGLGATSKLTARPTALSSLSYSAAVPSLVGIGLGYSMIGGVVWPCIPLLIRGLNSEYRNEVLGTAYGLATAIMNVALTIVPIGVAFVRVGFGGEENASEGDDIDGEDDSGWLAVEIFFTSLAMLGCLCSILIWWMDRYKGERVLEQWVSADDDKEDDEEQHTVL